MDEIRLGTIGTGSIVHDFLDQVSKNEGICLKTVYSRKEENGSSLAEKYGAENVYTDMDAFLSDETINTVYIASPNSLHFEQAKRALEAGKHVLCEKPFCMKAEEAEELNELSRRKNRLIAEMIPTAFLPNLGVIREKLPMIGRVRLIMSNYTQYSSRYDRLQAGELPNVFNPAFGGGCLMDINYYNLYLTVSLFGSPESATYYPNLHPSGIDTSGTAVLSYPDFQAVCMGAKDANGISFYQIEGENGYLHMQGGSNGIKDVRILTSESNNIVNMQPYPNRLHYEVKGVVRFLLEENRKEFDHRMEITIETVRLAEQLREKGYFSQSE